MNKKCRKCGKRYKRWKSTEYIDDIRIEVSSPLIKKGWCYKCFKEIVTKLDDDPYYNWDE